MPRKPNSKATRKAEARLLDKLLGDHGYSLMDAPKSKRTQMMFERDGTSSRIVPMRCVLLAVPIDSSLGKALDDRYGINKAKPT